jgi:ribonuclease P protein component
MLPKKERLDRVAFNRFFSVGTRFHSPSLMLIYSENEPFRASAVAPKKVAKTAVLRNKFRRRVYDVMRHMKAETGARGVFIVIAKNGAATLSYDSLKDELHTLIRKTGVVG